MCVACCAQARPRHARRQSTTTRCASLLALTTAATPNLAPPPRASCRRVLPAVSNTPSLSTLCDRSLQL